MQQEKSELEAMHATDMKNTKELEMREAEVSFERLELRQYFCHHYEVSVHATHM